MVRQFMAFLRHRIANARASKPAPPKPVTEMNMVEIDKFNAQAGLISRDRWWLFTWCVMVPITIAQGVRSYYLEIEHNKHYPEPYVPYENIQNADKPFPWGDGKRSLFFHPKWNPIPGEGYLWEKKDDE